MSSISTNEPASARGRVDRGEGAQGVVLHDGVEGVVMRGGGGGGGVGGRGPRRAHVFRAQSRQPQRLRRAGLRVQSAPQVQHLRNKRSSQTHLHNPGYG